MLYVYLCKVSRRSKMDNIDEDLLKLKSIKALLISGNASALKQLSEFLVNSENKFNNESSYVVKEYKNILTIMGKDGSNLFFNDILEKYSLLNDGKKIFIGKHIAESASIKLANPALTNNAINSILKYVKGNEIQDTLGFDRIKNQCYDKIAGMLSTSPSNETTFAIIKKLKFSFDNYSEIIKSFDKLLQKKQNKTAFSILSSVPVLYNHYATHITNEFVKLNNIGQKQGLKEAVIDALNSEIGFSDSSEILIDEFFIKPLEKYDEQIKLYKLDKNNSEYLDELNEPNANLKAKSFLGEFQKEDFFLDNVSLDTEKKLLLINLANVLSSSDLNENNLKTGKIGKTFSKGLASVSDDAALQIFETYINKDFKNDDKAKIGVDFFVKAIAKHQNIFDKYSSVFASFLKDDENTKNIISLDLSNNNESTLFFSILKATSRDYAATERLSPFIKEIIGNKRAEIYLANLRTIDYLPYKSLFVKEWISNSQVSSDGFLLNFGDKLNEIATGPEYNLPIYHNLSDTLKLDGFMDKALVAWDEMYKNKEKYMDIDSDRDTGSLYTIKENFAQQIKVLKDVTTDNKQDFLDAVKFAKDFDICSKAVMEYNEKNEVKIDSDRAAYDMVEAGIDDYKTASRAANIFCQINSRPKTYGSSYNTYTMEIIKQVADVEMPDWMYKIILDNKMINLERMGSVKNLFDACKGWNINPLLWKNEAERVGKMPLWMRVAAGAVINNMYKEAGSDLESWKHNKEYRSQFWLEMKNVQDMGMQKALLKLVENNAETRGRIISILHDNMDEEIKLKFREKGNAKDLLVLNLQDLNESIEKFSQIIDRNSIIENEHNLLIDCARAKMFLGDNIDAYIKNIPEDLKYPKNILSWLPRGLTPEKNISFKKFIDNKLFGKDGSNNIFIPDYKLLKDISQMWNSLTPQQEEMNFDRLAGLTYTKETKDQIESQYAKFKRIQEHNALENLKLSKKKIKPRLESLDNVNLVLPENLQLWQKLAISNQSFSNITQNEIDEIVNGDKKTILKNLQLTPISTSDEVDPNISIKRMVVDLTIGNRHDINSEERNYITNLTLNDIVEFNATAYTKTMNELVNREMKDPEASLMFRKNYVSITSSSAYSEDKKINDITDAYRNHKDWMIPAAIKTYNIFGAGTNNYFSKIDNYNKYVSAQMHKQEHHEGLYTYENNDILNIHNAVYWLPNIKKEKDKKTFIEFINKQFIYSDVNGFKHHRQTNEMEIIGNAWSELKEEELNLSFKDVLAKLRSKKYTSQKYTDFAEEAAKFGVTEESYKRMENIYESGLNTPTPFDSKVSFKVDNLTGRFLPRKDPRVGFFGNYTSCCQHFNGAGAQCAISSVKDPFSQLFVIENNNNEIIAGSWVWTNKKQYTDETNKNKIYKVAVFDNVEAKLSYSKKEQIVKIYEQAGEYMAKQNFRQITIGKACSDISLNNFSDASAIEFNSGYSGYSDAKSQVLLCDNKKAEPLDENATSLMVVGACQDDFYEMQNVANKCFPDGSQELEIPENEPRAMLLKDEKKVVGYILWTEDEKNTNSKNEHITNWIYDLAVLPEYRTGQKAGSAVLLSAMMKHVAEVGGEWGAELRDTTSLRYMRAMAGRNVIKMEELKEDHTMSDGSKVIEVKFNYIPEKKREVLQKNDSLFNKLKNRLSSIQSTYTVNPKDSERAVATPTRGNTR